MTPRGVREGQWPSHIADALAVPPSTEQRAQIVRWLADGRDREWIAARLHIRFDTVMRVAISIGYPNRERMNAAAAQLGGAA